MVQEDIESSPATNHQCLLFEFICIPLMEPSISAGVAGSL